MQTEDVSIVGRAHRPAGQKIAEPQASDLPLTIIKPANGWMCVDLPASWAYLELIHFLDWRVQAVESDGELGDSDLGRSRRGGGS